MKTLLGLFFVTVCCFFLGSGGFVAVELVKMIQANQITSTQSAIITLVVVTSLAFAVGSYRASKYAFKGQFRRFWKLINGGWLPV
ncbi:MAG: hypothetical protein HZB70_01240 [Candidatus Berkelbacteria bacterium]|nr:MAG: hypothetical protein HZB70_01240 [Candidatus Berkelbacteria bacterium]QQG52036.1 MAG: hypothetical protein HY845_01755 [Candidatus Berkelbacteria bacterium]